MTVEIDKEEYLADLKKVMKEYYHAKLEGDKKKIKYYQGFTKGMIFTFRKLQLFTQEELESLAKDAELDIPSVFRLQE